MTTETNMGSNPVRWFNKYPAITVSFIVTLFILLIDLFAGLFFIPRDINNFRTDHPFYHHGMLPEKTGYSKWGDGDIYPVSTNSLGMLDSSTRKIDLISSKKRIVIIGDSYTEGIGVPFEESFVGLLQKKFEQSNIEILNAASLSYSPKLYYLKIKYLIEKIGLQFDELYVFIDISDIQDEVLYRRYIPDSQDAEDSLKTKLVQRSKKLFFSLYSLDLLYLNEKRNNRKKKYNAQYYPPWLDYFFLENQDTEPYMDRSFAKIRSDWTTDTYFNNRWTQLGLKLAIENMNKLVRLCRDNNIKLTLAAYPWPAQIFRKEIESRQVYIWKSFSAVNNLPFINLFPDFIGNPSLSQNEVYSMFFIQGDVHWNQEGHKLVAGKVGQYISSQ